MHHYVLIEYAQHTVGKHTVLLSSLMKNVILNVGNEIIKKIFFFYVEEKRGEKTHVMGLRNNKDEIQK